MKKILVFFPLVSFLFSCQKEITKLNRIDNELNANITTKQAKKFLLNYGGPFANGKLVIGSNENSKIIREASWGHHNFYNSNGITYLEVPFLDEKKIMHYPLQTFLFFKNQNGEIEGRLKTIELLKSNEHSRAIKYIESLYSLNGKHLETKINNNGKKYKVEILPKNSSMVNDGGCAYKGFTFITIFYDNPGDSSKNCNVHYEPYIAVDCGDGDISVKSQEVGGGGTR